jgi:hypothetical protein
MSKSKETIEVEKIKKRIPVPQKPPKTEKKKKAYDRKKEKEKGEKIIKEINGEDD